MQNTTECRNNGYEIVKLPGASCQCCEARLLTITRPHIRWSVPESPRDSHISRVTLLRFIPFADADKSHGCRAVTRSAF